MTNTIHKGDLLIDKGTDPASYAQITSVTGGLYIRADASLPFLESVGGSLYIRADASLPLLESVGCYLYIDEDVSLPKLENVDGYMSIHADVSLSAPKYYPKGFDSYKDIDGINCFVMSTKAMDGVNILSCRKPRIKDQKVVGDKFYIAQQDDYSAHGHTIKEAVEELAFKQSSRDVSEYRNMPLDTVKTPQEWALVYRAVTGACRFGTEMFMSDRELKETYTLAEILEETKDAYGSDKFRSVVQ